MGGKAVKCCIEYLLSLFRRYMPCIVFLHTCLELEKSCPVSYEQKIFIPLSLILVLAHTALTFLNVTPNQTGNT